MNVVTEPRAQKTREIEDLVNLLKDKNRSCQRVEQLQEWPLDSLILDINSYFARIVEPLHFQEKRLLSYFYEADELFPLKTNYWIVTRFILLRGGVYIC